MKKKIVLLVLAFFIILNGGLSAQKLSRKERNKVLKNLAPHYKQWYNMVYYISLKEERQVFLSLKNNRDRDIFIRSFWQQRDPTPGTVENEYQEEIKTRFAHVQKYFSRGTSKEGWMTEMGMYYMILGKPNSIERFDSRPGLYPAQVWYYFGDKSLGLPTYFSVTFFKPNNTTEWKFYNPSVDGPAALLIKTEGYDDSNYEALYDKIRELAPELAMPALSMIPNEIAPGFRPPLRNNLIVSNIHESPKRKINVSYATHFLNYKGYVDVEASVNFIANSNLVSVTKYDLFGFPFVNISIKPKAISLGYSNEKDQYYFSYDLNVSLKKGSDFILEEKKHYDFYFDPDKVGVLRGNGLVLHYAFPAIPGKYKLTVFAMNSVGKEFTYFDKEITIPAPTGGPTLATPVLGHKTEDQQDNFFFPYRFNNQKLFVDTERNFRLRESPLVLLGAYNLDRELWETGKIVVLLKGLNERQKYEKTYEVPLKLHSFNTDLNILQRIGEEGLNPDYYELEVKLLDGSGKMLDSKTATFSISPLSNFAYAMESFNKVRIENPGFLFASLASQYNKLGNLDGAEKYYARSVALNPQDPAVLVPYLYLLNKRKKYTQVMVEVEKLKDNQNLALDYHLIKATALYGMKDFNEALNQLLEANKVYDSDTRVLNLLGFTFLMLKEKNEALKAFDASLKVNDKQVFIKQTIEKVTQQKVLK
jgi:GWxTD domain-containing protein